MASNPPRPCPGPARLFFSTEEFESSQNSQARNRMSEKKQSLRALKPNLESRPIYQAPARSINPTNQSPTTRSKPKLENKASHQTPGKYIKPGTQCSTSSLEPNFSSPKEEFFVFYGLTLETILDDDDQNSKKRRRTPRLMNTTSTAPISAAESNMDTMLQVFDSMMLQRLQMQSNTTQAFFVASSTDIEQARIVMQSKIEMLWRSYWVGVENVGITCSVLAHKIKKVRTLTLATRLAHRFLQSAFKIDDSTNSKVHDLSDMSGAVFNVAMKMEGTDFLNMKWTAKKILHGQFWNKAQLKDKTLSIARKEFLLMDCLGWRMDYTVVDGLQELCNCTTGTKSALILNEALDFVEEHGSSGVFQAIPANTLAVLLFEKMSVICPGDPVQPVLKVDKIKHILRMAEESNEKRDFEAYFFAMY